MYHCEQTFLATFSSTDGRDGLECDGNGKLAYCGTDSIPGACVWSETTPICVGCELQYITEQKNGDLQTVVAGGKCK